MMTTFRFNESAANTGGEVIAEINNKSGMGAETIKTRVSPKNQMSRRNLTIIGG